MVIARAPVRISFGGGGTDLEAYYARHGGVVVSAAITCYSTVAVRPTEDGSIRIRSADYGILLCYPHGERLKVEEPLALPKAALEAFVERGLLSHGVELSLAAAARPGTGLGSSSAMAIALCRALAAYCNTPMSDGEIAEMACWIEIERLGMPIGKQDQYASAFGGLNRIEFTCDGVTVTPLGLSSEALAALSERLVLFSTGQSRDSSSILRQQRHDSAVDGAVVTSLHRIKALAHDMEDALCGGDFDNFGTLLDHAWQVKRGLSGRISTTDIDRWYAAAREVGALGGKITGAGGGGYLLLYCPVQRQQRLREAMTTCGLREMSFAFDRDGARIVDAREQGVTHETFTAAEQQTELTAFA